MRRLIEPVDLPSLRSQANVNWSLAADEKDMDSATHDMAAQCGGGGQFKSDLLITYTYEVVPTRMVGLNSVFK
jgi:hypothetical protein